MHFVFSSLVATTLNDNTTYRDNDRFGLKKERVEEIKDEEEWRVATLGPGEGGQQNTYGWLEVGIPAHRVQQSVGAMTEIKAGAARARSPLGWVPRKLPCSRCSGGRFMQPNTQV